MRTAKEYGRMCPSAILEELNFRDEIVEIANILYEFVHNNHYSTPEFTNCYETLGWIYHHFPEVQEKFIYDDSQIRQYRFMRIGKFNPANTNEEKLLPNPCKEVIDEIEEIFPTVINDDKIFHMPCALSNYEEGGLYFVGMVGTNPLTGENYYLAKVGSAENISKRIKQYAVCNPMIYHNNCILPVHDRKRRAELEKAYHAKMANESIGYAQNSQEWFYFTKEQYMKFCNQFATIEGFSYYLREN